MKWGRSKQSKHSRCTPVPSYYSGNFFLSLSQMQVNATYLYGLLNAEGWTLHAIAGLLGNTQTESTHNPGIWQNLTPNKGGYGSHSGRLIQNILTGVHPGGLTNPKWNQRLQGLNLRLITLMNNG